MVSHGLPSTSAKKSDLQTEAVSTGGSDPVFTAGIRFSQLGSGFHWLDPVFTAGIRLS